MNRTSEIKLPISISKFKLISLIDSFIPDTLFEKSDGDILSVYMKINKGRLMNIEFNDKSVDIVLSLKVEVGKHFGGKMYSEDGEIVLDLYSQFDIDENWNFSTKTTLVDYQWTKIPELDLIFKKISLVSIADKFIDSKQSFWLNEIDNYIAENKIFKKQIEDLFLKFKTPFPIDSAKVLGLKITPQLVKLSPFKTNKDKIEGAVDVKFDSDIVLMNNIIPFDSSKVTFKWSQYNGYNPKAAISFTMDKLHIQRLLDEYIEMMPVSNREFNLKDNAVQIDHVEVLFDKGLFGAIVYFSGDKNGSVKTLIRPYWNEKMNQFRLLERDVDFKIHELGSRILLALFGRSAKEKMVDMIEQKLNTSLKQIIIDTNKSFKKDSLDTPLAIIDYNIPVQVEEGLLLIDINLDMSGSINWKGIDIHLSNTNSNTNTR